ncbi:hypothetical protein SAMN05720781_3244 [Fibrobacter sp. UWT3]|uniref:hypothetical protein n=1 Tax=Fibrobacter sp. UWT3 TaxID=1896225 RepID=UPI000BDC7F88|nr:hypothetical protein [Fibrobacter sp. UWT3]SOE80081.1 hypothetical protein SAMN05720781_3244 [Fibrobacter sp. UWT3]
MDTDRLEWRFANLKHHIRDGIDFEGRFFGTDKGEYTKFIEEARQELVEMPVPEYDEKNPDLLTLYFVLASALYLVYDLFSLKSPRYQAERDELACRVRESVGRIPLRDRVSRSDRVACDFDIINPAKLDENRGTDVPYEWLHHEDAWLDERLWPFKAFIDTGKVPKMGLSGFLWLFLKYFRHSLPVGFENYDIVGDNFFDSLAAYCAYARNEEKLIENVNNYALNLFANIKGRSLSFERGLRKLRYICKKGNLLTTIKDNEEFIDLLRYHNFVKASNRGYNSLYNSLLNLVNKAFDSEDDCAFGDEPKQERLLDSIRSILSQKITFLKKWPFLAMFCYMMVHYLEEEELLQLFKKPVGEGGELIFKDIKECPGLQCLFFFTLFDMSYGAKVNGRYEIGDDFLTALERGDWFEPAVQSKLFMRILEQNGINCSITADEMTFKKYIDKRFFATQSVLNLMYNVACYSESRAILNITQQINNIGEHRSVFVYPKVQATFANEPENKAENWVKPYTKRYTDYTADEQKKMKLESDKMKKIDCGILLPNYLQQIPGCSNQFFSRNFEMKLFLQTDVSCVPGPEGILQKRDYHLQRNRRMLECGYLHYARNMKTHNVDLNYTGSLLNSRHYPDLLRILYSLMRQMQKDCSQSDLNNRLFKFEDSNSLDDDSIWDTMWISNEKWLLEEAIEKKDEMGLLDYLKSCESMIERSVLDKDTDKSAVELFQDLANLHKRLVGRFSPNVDAAAMKVSDAAKGKLLAMQESYDAVSYDLFKNEPDYGSPFLKKCISLLLQVIQCVTSTAGVVDQLKKKSEFNEEGVQRPLLNREGDVTFEDMGDQVTYPKALVKELRAFLDTVFGMEYLRQSENDRINRNVFHLYGYKIMLYLMKVTLQMTRMDLKAVYGGRN